MTDNNTMRLCVECKKFKPENKENFPLNRKRPDGSLILRTRCKPCHNEYRKRYKCRDIEGRKKKAHANYLKHKEKVKKRSNNRYYKNKKDEEMSILKEFFEEQRKKIEEMYSDKVKK